MSIQLYYAPVACSMVPYINLTEAGASFEVITVNMQKGENRSAEYLRMNPKHNVPVLVIDGEVLTENVAINLWIAGTFPKATLLPANPMAELQAVSLMTWFASGIHPALTPNFIPERFCDTPGTAENVRECAQRRLAEAFGIVDQRLAGKDWFFDHYTAPDAYFFWTFLRATRFNLKYLELGQFKHCHAHMERMKQRPSVQKLLSFEKSVQDKFEAAI